MTHAFWVLGLGPWVLGQGDFGITVEAAARDAFCPAVEATREAVRARVGTVEVPNGGSWRALYTIVHAPGAAEGDHIRLELRDPAGALKLERDIPIAGESCTTLAQIVALVIERYFRDLSTASAKADRAPAEAIAAPPPALSPATSPSPASPAPAETGEGRAPNEDAASRRFTAGVFGGVSSVTRTPGLGLGARLRLGPVPRLRASVHVPVRAREERFAAGTLQLEEYSLRAAVTAALEINDIELELGPELLVALERGAATGLPDAAAGARWVPGIGLQARAAYWASPRFGIEFGVSADAIRSDLTSEFAVGDRGVLAPAPVRGVLALGVVWAMIE